MKIEISERSYDRLMRSLVLWSAPPREIETVIVRYLTGLDSFRVACVSLEEVQQLDSRPHESYRNCKRFCDQHKGWQIVSGWVQNNETYSPHAVVKLGDRMRCVTRSEKFIGSIDFIPDDDLRFLETTAGLAKANWHGNEIPVGCRHRPAEMASAAVRLFRLLLDGEEWRVVCADMSRNGLPV